MKQLNPHISVDCVLFGFGENNLNVLLVPRQEESNTKSKMKLPGGLVYDDEDLDDSAQRILNELTGLDKILLKKFDVFGAPNRISSKMEDKEWLQNISNLPINRVVTIAYYAIINMEVLKNQKNKQKAIWYPVNKLPQLIFDHNEIVKKAIENLRKEIQYSPLEFEFLPKKFSLRQLQTVYEKIFDDILDNRNFRKKMSTYPYIVCSDEKEKEVAHKPALLYYFDKKIYSKHNKENQKII